MADLISFSLPEMPRINDNESIDVKKALKQIQNYMFLLTEQMKFYLNNIDADNFNDAYAEKVAGVLGKTPSNSKYKPYEAFVQDLNAEIESAKESLSEAIKVGNTGRVLLNDSKNDGVTDEVLIIDAENIENAIHVWRINANGFGYSGTGYNGKYTIGILPDGRILASGIIGDYIKGLEIEGGIIRGGYIEGAEGNIGGWTFSPDQEVLENNNSTTITELDGKIYQRRIIVENKTIDNTTYDYPYTYEFTLKSDTSEDQDKKAIYSNCFRPYKDETGVRTIYRPVNSDTKSIECSDGTLVQIEPDNYREEQFFIRRNGEYYTPNSIKVGGTDENPHIKLKPGSTTNTVVPEIKMKYGSTYEASFSPAGISFKNEDGSHTISTYSENLVFSAIPDVLLTGNSCFSQKAKLNNNFEIGFNVDSTNSAVDNNSESYIRLGQDSYISAYGWNDTQEYIQIGRRAPVGASGTKETLVAITASNLTNTAAAPLYITASGTFRLSSSAKRYKENITTKIPGTLNPEKLYGLKVYSFNFKPEYKEMELCSGEQIGFLADEVARIYPKAAIFNKNGEVESWHERILIPAMLKLIQDQHDEIIQLKKDITELKESKL